MKRKLTTAYRLLVALLMISLLPLSVVSEEGQAQLTLPQGETSPYTQQVEGQWVLCLPITLTAEGLNESLFLQSGQLELSYDADRLQYLGTSEQLLSGYACTYADPTTGLEVQQSWVVNGTEAGKVRMAFASPYGCKVADGILLQLCFAFTDTAQPGDSLSFAIANPLFTFVDGEQHAVSMDTVPSAALLTLSSQADRSVLQAEYDRHYNAIYNEAGELAVSIGDTRDLTEGTPYLSSADLKADATALSAAHKILTNASATQQEIDAGVKALQESFIFPTAHTLSYEELEGKIAIAQEKIDSSEFASYSVQLQKKWKEALSNAQSLLTEEARATNTQRKLDNAAKAITELVKTGDAEWVLLLPFLMLLCAAGLVITLKKRRSLEG